MKNEKLIRSINELFDSIDSAIVVIIAVFYQLIFWFLVYVGDSIYSDFSQVAVFTFYAVLFVPAYIIAMGSFDNEDYGKKIKNHNQEKPDTKNNSIKNYEVLSVIIVLVLVIEAIYFLIFEIITLFHAIVSKSFNIFTRDNIMLYLMAVTVVIAFHMAEHKLIKRMFFNLEVVEPRQNR